MSEEKVCCATCKQEIVGNNGVALAYRPGKWYCMPFCMRAELEKLEKEHPESYCTLEDYELWKKTKDLKPSNT